MATNLAIDDRLIDAARQIGHHATKKAAVTAALEEYVNRRKQLEILKLAGTIDYSVKKCVATCPIQARVLPIPDCSYWSSGVTNDQ